MKSYLLLQDGTIGALWNGVAGIGEFVTVSLHDENGNEIKITGIVEAIL